MVLNTNTRRGNVILGEKYRTIWGQDFLMDTLCGLSFKLSVPSFYQVNRDQAEVLYGKALEYAGLTGQETVLDLYCGTGTITLCLAAKAGRAIGAEIVAPAIRDARENAARNGVEMWSFSAETPLMWLPSWSVRDCGRMWSAWTRPGRALPRRSSNPWRPWGRPGWCTFPAIPLRWDGT